RDWLRSLLDAYEGNRWLVTSRPTAVRDDWLAADGFTELALSPMTRSEVATFVRRWHRAAGPEAEPYEQPLLDALRTAEHVAQLATNPLMCGLICALHRDRRGFLPRGRKALYEAALSMLLARRDRERDMGAPSGLALDEAPQIQLIQRLAYWLTLNGRTQLDRARAESLVREAVPAVQEAAQYPPEKVFTHLLHRSGLLREPTADTVDFVHRTFQDYLAAKALVDHWDIGVLVRHAADDQWEDVIRMAVGHARPRECAEILQELLKAADAATNRPVRLRLVLLAATALDHATEVSPEVREEVLQRTSEVIPPRTFDEARELAGVGRLVLDLLPGPEGLSDEEAQMVVTTATHVSVDAAIPYLARFAGHSSVGVRSQLIWAWSRFDNRTYAEGVVARLDPAGLDFTVRHNEQVDELTRLGLRPTRLSIGPQVTNDVVAALLHRCNPTQLTLERTLHSLSLAFLSGLDRLEHLALDFPPEAIWSADDLPAAAPLASLSMSTWPHRGLGALRHLGQLTEVLLWSAPDLAAEQWRGLAVLPSLTSLSIDVDDLDTCPPDLVMPAIVDVCLAHGDLPSLGPLVRVFPSLRTIELGCAHVLDTVDVSPLAELNDLETVWCDSRPTGTEHLPP
ncbi:NACHT domain-containing NTPase, partial [Streptomyces sp. NRRL B-24572]|uniref:NACHT domain-containing protein n=1 Tax=Streptomyces sp. NRRL B-24572 TaxID=1962156 RepID=UPI0035901404